MRCLVLSRDGNVSLEERPIPSPFPSHALLRVLTAGICSTDLAVIDNRIHGPRPLILGHEFVGILNNDPARGLCAAEINLTCRVCSFCMKGLSKHCANRTALGISTDGVFADFVRVPQENVHFLPPSISVDEAVFVEPLAAAVDAVRGRITPEMSVGVIGTGKLGLLLIQVLRSIGVENVLTVGRGQEKLRLAAQFGSSEVVSANDIGKINPHMLDAVIEASGSPNGLQEALRLVKSAGMIVLKSTPGNSGVVDVSDIVRREISVFGSRCGPFPEAIKLLEQKRIRTRPLISARFPLEEFEMALEFSRRHTTIKVLFDIGQHAI